MTTENTTAATTVAKRPFWQRVLGIKRRNAGARLGFIKFAPTRWGLVLIIMITMAGGMAAFAEYSMQPDFCRSCHLMEPYFTAWHDSKHKNVPCVQCHFEPGFGNTVYGKFQASSQAVKYITQTYGSKPHAQISDKSCLRSECHETRVLQGKVNWKIPTERGGEVTIKFDHTPHLTSNRRGVSELRCVSCHSQMVQGKHIVVTTDTCFLCHFKGLKHGRDDQTIGTCQGCHDAPKREIRLATGSFTHQEYVDKGVLCQNCHADTVRGEGKVPQQTCWNCHNQTDQIARYGETATMHKLHVSKHKVECSSCHVQIEHSLIAGAREDSTPHARFSKDSGACGQCHEQTHMGPKELYRGQGGRGVPEMPSPMARSRVNCIACHVNKKLENQNADVVGQTYVATQDRCNYCHKEKYQGSLDEWRKTIATHQAKADAALLSAQRALAKATLAPERELEVKRLLGDAEHNVRFVKLGHGVHNVTYATALLNVAVERSTAAEKLIAEKK